MKVLLWEYHVEQMYYCKVQPQLLKKKFEQGLRDSIDLLDVGWFALDGFDQLHGLCHLVPRAPENDPCGALGTTYSSGAGLKGRRSYLLVTLPTSSRLKPFISAIF